MYPQYSPQSRAERVIAAGRVVLATASVLALSFGPIAPGRDSLLAAALLFIYCLYSLFLLVVAWDSPAPHVRFGPVTHLLDFVIFSVFMFFTEGPASPFFVYFVFSLLSATLRWHWRGTFWTAMAALAVFSGMGFYATIVPRQPPFDPSLFVVRGINLGVVAVLLGYLGAHQQRLQGEVSRLASWPRTVSQDLAAVVREVLEHAAGIVRAPRVLLLWEEHEEPWLHVASWFGNHFNWSREPPGTFEPVVAAPLVGASFLCEDAGAARPRVVHSSSAGVERWRGSPLHSTLQARFGIRGVVSLELHGEDFGGRLFFLDLPSMTLDDLRLGEIVARQAAAHLDHYYLLQRLRDAAATAERIRLARDLHDGVLQSLTGTALQLQAATRLLDEDPQAVKARLQEIQRIIDAEHLELRAFISELKPATASAASVEFDVASRVRELAERLGRQWGISVDVTIGTTNGVIPGRLGHDVYRIIHEAVVNAARHSGASSVNVELGLHDNQVRIMVTNDGHGFAFKGRYDLATLTAMKRGPVTLKERITARGGNLVIVSTDTGSRLEITLPLARPEA